MHAGQWARPSACMPVEPPRILAASVSVPSLSPTTMEDPRSEFVASRAIYALVAVLVLVAFGRGIRVAPDPVPLFLAVAGPLLTVPGKLLLREAIARCRHSPASVGDNA